MLLSDGAFYLHHHFCLTAAAESATLLATSCKLHFVWVLYWTTGFKPDHNWHCKSSL